MMKATWMRLGSPAWLAIGLVMLLPTLAQAQLFPNRTIRRERPPCNSEPPFNAQVRRDYFGYYPTCWTRFPSGWACPCPNPELPNLAESISKNGPLGRSRPPVEGDRRPDGMDEENPDAARDGRPGTPAGTNPNIPLPNEGRSPFDIDPSPTPGPGAPPRPNLGDPSLPPSNPGRPSGSTSLMEMPKLPETAPSTSYESPLKPGSLATAPEATLTSSETSDLRPDLGPLPSSSQPNTTVPSASATSTFPAVVGSPAPAQAPRRRGILGGLFGGNTRTR